MPIIGLTVSRNKYATELPETIFMGIGYNGRLDRKEERWPSVERFDMLQYFAIMKTLPSINWVLWDASGFQIVNRLPKKKYEKLGPQPKAEDVLDALITEQDRPKRSEIIANCDERYRNLRQFSEITDVNAKVVESRVVFRTDKRFADALDMALEYTERLKQDNPDLVGRILPKNPNPGCSLYLPLEIAEALYLEKFYGINGKFGPETEKNFDECIRGVQEGRNVGYTTILCPSSPVRPGYLDTNEPVLRLGNRDVYFEMMFRKQDDQYMDFVRSYLRPFKQDDETDLRCAIRLKGELGGRKESFFFGAIPETIRGGGL